MSATPPAAASPLVSARKSTEKDATQSPSGSSKSTSGAPKVISRPQSATANRSRPPSERSPSRPQSAGSAKGSNGSNSRPQSAGSVRGGDSEEGPPKLPFQEFRRRPLSKMKNKPIIRYKEPEEDMGLNAAALEKAARCDELIFDVTRMMRVIYSRNMKIAWKKQQAHDALKAKQEAKIAAKEAAKAAKKEAKRLENIKNGIMPGKKKKSDDSDDESEEESSEDESEEDEDDNDEDKEKNDNPFDEPDEEFVKAEEEELTGKRLELTTLKKELASQIVASRKNREYTSDAKIIAKQFLDMHHSFLKERDRDYFSLVPSFHDSCEVNFGSGHLFSGAEATARALAMSVGDVELGFEVADIQIDDRVKQGLLTSFTAVVMISVDGDKPRRVMECYEIKQTKKEAMVDAYVCSKLLTILNDPRPLYLFSDREIEVTKNDNMEPWARALMPPTPEELLQMQLDKEAAEAAEMAIEDEVATAIETKFRAEYKAAKRKAEAEAEKKRKAAMFGGDDEDEDEEGEEEDGEEGEEGEGGEGEGEGEGEEDGEGGEGEGEGGDVPAEDEGAEVAAEGDDGNANE